MGHYIAYLHQLLDDISAEDMVKDHLKKWVGHQVELQPVPMPDQDGALLEGGDGHLEVLVRGDAEPLGRVEELVLGDDVEWPASLRDQQAPGEDEGERVHPGDLFLDHELFGAHQSFLLGSFQKILELTFRDLERQEQLGVYVLHIYIQLNRPHPPS